MFKKVSGKLLYQDKWVEFHVDSIQFDNGTMGTYTWTNRMSGVGTVVVTDDQLILLHKEFRYVIQQYSWEIPGGGIETGEEPQRAAVREVREEAGIELQSVVPLGVFYPLHSFNREQVHLFIGRVNHTNAHLRHIEDGEMIVEQQFFTFDQALAMIDSGQINDAMTAHAIQMAIRKINQEKSSVE